jgi:uncharacterized protein (TIGR03086 family)
MTTSPETAMLDFAPATATLGELIRNLRDDQLDAATPCRDTSVAVLVDHVDGLAHAFAAAARKAPVAGPGGIHESFGPEPGWRSRIPQRLDELADAWREPEAWSGMTAAGGIEMPAEVAALVALDEVVVHGWDIAVATGQPFEPDPKLVAAALQWVQPFATNSPNGVPGLFGPAVRVPDDASDLDRLIGLTGRDPSWRPTG